MLPSQRLESDISYFQHSPIQRLLSASIAISISLAFISLLNQDFLKKIVPTTAPVTAVMMLNFIRANPQLVNTKSTELASTSTKVNPPRQLQVRESRPPKTIYPPENVEASKTKPKSELNPQRDLIEVFPEQPTSDPSTSSLANQLTKSSVSKYGFDSASVKQAYDASKSDIQKMAEKSGTSLDDPKSNKHEKFQQAANRAAKPDCLRQGGSILSLFVVAYQVATDHCK